MTIYRGNWKVPNPRALSFLFPSLFTSHQVSLCNLLEAPTPVKVVLRSPRMVWQGRCVMITGTSMMLKWFAECSDIRELLLLLCTSLGVLCYFFSPWLYGIYHCNSTCQYRWCINNTSSITLFLTGQQLTNHQLILDVDPGRSGWMMWHVLEQKPAWRIVDTAAGGQMTVVIVKMPV